MADLVTYLAAVGRHWKSGATGGVLAVILMLASTFHPLPKTYIATALVGYVLVAGFFAWRDEYQRLLIRPIEKRERLDALARTGKTLQNKCLGDKKITFITKLRTKLWIGSVSRFVRQNFNMAQYDVFADNQPRPASIFRLELARIKSEFPGNFEAVYEIIRRLEGLDRLRDSIA